MNTRLLTVSIAAQQQAGNWGSLAACGLATLTCVVWPKNSGDSRPPARLCFFLPASTQVDLPSPEALGYSSRPRYWPGMCS